VSRIVFSDAALDAIKPPTDRPQAYYWDTEISGLGIVIGARAQTFVVSWRDERGVKRRKAIGRRGHRLPDNTWLNVARARDIASDWLGNKDRSSPLERAERELRAAMRRWLEIKLGLWLIGRHARDD